MTSVKLTAITAADVYKGHQHAGTLTRTKDSTEFRYLPDYLARKAPQIAHTLPLASHPYHSTGGAVPPFFAGLLPEGARLQALIGAVKTSADDELSLLIAVGEDCIGDVRVLPTGADPHTRQAPPLLVQPEDVSFTELFQQAIDRPHAARNIDGIAGVQEKISDRMITFPVRFGGAGHILKLNPPKVPRLVQNEHFFLHVAASVGFRVPRTTLLHDRTGEAGLLIERFDRHIGPEQNLVRIAQEDACQLAGRWPADKYRLSYRDVMETVTDTVPAPIPAALHLMRLLAFSYLIGNGDLHAKNISVHEPKPGLATPTPVYDVLSTLPYGDRSMALPVDGRDDHLTAKGLTTFASRFGVPEPAMHATLRQLIDRSAPFGDRLGEIGLPERRTRDLLTTMTARANELRPS